MSKIFSKEELYDRTPRVYGHVDASEVRFFAWRDWNGKFFGEFQRKIFGLGNF